MNHKVCYRQLQGLKDKTLNCHSVMFLLIYIKYYENINLYNQERETMMQSVSVVF